MRNPTHRLAKLSITVSYKIKHKQVQYESPDLYFNINKLGQKPFVILFILNNLFLKMTKWPWTGLRGEVGGGGGMAKELDHVVDFVDWKGERFVFWGDCPFPSPGSRSGIGSPFSPSEQSLVPG